MLYMSDAGQGMQYSSSNRETPRARKAELYHLEKRAFPP
jgi:hypothetical protein